MTSDKFIYFAFLPLPHAEQDNLKRWEERRDVNVCTWSGQKCRNILGQIHFF